ncbi:30S ribosomal protein S17 [Acetilactobacillus jinshanensis]|uniref:30S ribosomal protein S17 n=1 Tax=Acetilactobacillus jinshanensis TaxID=1720083 RepID=UPI00214F9673|nr:30S ribosomal protein S17 [Acetilactobacillus jinshanensis]
MRDQRKIFRGRVVSTKMDKTITVLVSTYKDNPVYGKRVRYSKKYKAHDKNNAAHVGDYVEIMNCRPLSKTVHTRLVKVLQKSVKQSLN